MSSQSRDYDIDVELQYYVGVTILKQLHINLGDP